MDTYVCEMALPRAHQHRTISSTEEKERQK